MEQLEARLRQMEAALQATVQQAQAAEARALAAEQVAAAATAAQRAGTGQTRTAVSTASTELIDTKLLSKPKVFNGNAEEWASWSFKMTAYLGFWTRILPKRLLTRSPCR